MNLRLLARRSVWLPTWRGWLVLLLLVSFAVWLAGWRLHPFLATSDPLPNADVLVTEGWVPDYALRAATNEFARKSYRWLVTSGGPLQRGELVTGYSTYAELAGASILRLGFPRERLVIAPGDSGLRNRTYRSAQAVKVKLAESGITPQGINVLTVGTHARRTVTVFRKVMGKSMPVGVISLPSLDYDPERWWASSEGTKETITETLGYLYERWLNGGRE